MRHLKIPGPRRTNCEPIMGLFRSTIVRPQSGSLACNAAVFSERSSISCWKSVSRQLEFHRSISSPLLQSTPVGIRLLAVQSEPAWQRRPDKV